MRGTGSILVLKSRRGGGDWSPVVGIARGLDHGNLARLAAKGKSHCCIRHDREPLDAAKSLHSEYRFAV